MATPEEEDGDTQPHRIGDDISDGYVPGRLLYVYYISLYLTIFMYVIA